jgi:CHAT domain-containing protein
VIVPHGELHYLPFAALTDGKRYLMDDYSITYLPSVSAWPYIKQNVGKSNANPLIIGNPSTNRADLQSLPFAESEAQTIANLYQVTPLLGKDATENAVRTQVGQAGVLHLAAHGSYNTINPMYSAIYLAPDGQNDGLLETHEIYGLDLKQTDLVVLSACETQLGELSTGDELVGLTRAFLFAGTPSVISSLWSVDDNSTQLLMEKFYTYWSGGMSKAEALRQAQIDVRAIYPNPYYWAGFVLSGDGGKSTGLNPFQNLEPTNLLIIIVSLCCCCLLFGSIVIVTGWVILKRKRR